MFCGEKLIDYFFPNDIYFWKCQESEKKRKQKGRADFGRIRFISSLLIPQAKCQLVQASYIKRITFFLFAPDKQHIIN